MLVTCQNVFTPAHIQDVEAYSRHGIKIHLTTFTLVYLQNGGNNTIIPHYCRHFNVHGKYKYNRVA